jgi:SAM-dependent methyltransferase
VIWPLPALLVWAGAWALFIALQATAAPPWIAFALATGLGGVLSLAGATAWRRAFIAAGFPLSLAASGLAGTLPAWAWLLPLLLLALVYPLHAWRDAPLFPTPPGALDGLAALAPLPDGARVLDAGCGLGDGLIALRREYPRARLAGLEWSWPLRMACAVRCRFATIRRADIWSADWSSHDMVYLFQRPESMARATDKARRELRHGAWLASLEFEAPDLAPHAVVGRGSRPVWIYRAPLQPRAAST